MPSITRIQTQAAFRSQKRHCPYSFDEERGSKRQHHHHARRMASPPPTTSPSPPTPRSGYKDSNKDQDQKFILCQAETDVDSNHISLQRPNGAVTSELHTALKWLNHSHYYGAVIPNGAFFRSPIWFAGRQGVFCKNVDTGNVEVPVSHEDMPSRPSTGNCPAPTCDKFMAVRQMDEDAYYRSRPVGVSFEAPKWFFGSTRRFIRDRITNRIRPFRMMDSYHSCNLEVMQKHYLDTYDVDVLE